MGIFEKRRFRNFLVDCNDTTKLQKKLKDPVEASKMRDVYKAYGLDENTQDFIGHALALYHNDEYNSLHCVVKFTLFVNCVILDTWKTCALRLLSASRSTRTRLRGTASPRTCTHCTDWGNSHKALLGRYSLVCNQDFAAV